MVNGWLSTLQLGVFPPTCVLCGADGAGGRDLCPGCLQALPRLGRHCAVCAQVLPEQGGRLCGACLASPPPFDHLLAPFVYEPPLDWLIPRLKFQARLAHAQVLGHLLAEHVEDHVDVFPDVVLPVPLHPARLRERGFNQALELARPVARRLGLPLRTRWLRRVKSTEAQMGLTARRRVENIRGAFVVTGPVTGQRIALVDDVVTTGSTVGEIARRLKRAGAVHVQVWAVARA